jgi:cytochrome o ubiquinol oxidase subunit 2
MIDSQLSSRICCAQPNCQSVSQQIVIDSQLSSQICCAQSNCQSVSQQIGYNGQLGSQIYAMAGMQTRLHLLADKPGAYAGHNQQFSGRGYADMHFKANAVSLEEFQSWVQKIRQSPEKLDTDRYEKLAKPSVGYHPVTYFSSVKPDLFGYILRKFDPTWGQNHDHMSRGSDSPHARTDIAEAN